MKQGLILMNLGTPDAPATAEVRKYLREFLMDPFVVDIPWPLRALLVHGLILPTRPAKSAEAYRKVWTPEGSPLLVYLNRLVQAVRSELGEGWQVEPAMRYGSPSIESAIRALSAQGVTDLTVFPMYPQYSLAATESSIERTRALLKRLAPGMKARFIGPFYDNPAFLDAFAGVISNGLAGFDWDHLLFSFHGLPERQVKRTDPTGEHCLVREGCCDAVGEANRGCYRAQCFATARGLASRLGLPSERYTVCFQSRLGRTPWISPYTDLVYPELPKRGIRRLAVACPAFVADCLETLEEIQIRGAADFSRFGGEALRLAPSLNDSAAWARAVVSIVEAEGKVG